MIELIPSLSLLEGKCVRLAQGDYDKKTIYTENPVDIARRFEDHGIRRLHLIDLDGAKNRTIVNYPALELIAGHTKLNIDFGGGIQTDGDVSKALEYGAKMVTVGSVAATDPDIFSGWIISYGRSKIILGADTLHRKIAIGGRQKETNINIIDHIEYFHTRGIQYVKCADVAKDGMLEGPNFKLYEEILQRFPDLKLMASGGVSSIDDIKRLADLGVSGVLIGKAYYENRITLKDMEAFIASA